LESQTSFAHWKTDLENQLTTAQTAVVSLNDQIVEYATKIKSLKVWLDQIEKQTPLATTVPPPLTTPVPGSPTPVLASTVTPVPAQVPAPVPISATPVLAPTVTPVPAAVPISATPVLAPTATPVPAPVPAPVPISATPVLAPTATATATPVHSPSPPVPDLECHICNSQLQRDPSAHPESLVDVHNWVCMNANCGKIEISQEETDQLVSAASHYLNATGGHGTGHEWLTWMVQCTAGRGGKKHEFEEDVKREFLANDIECHISITVFLDFWLKVHDQFEGTAISLDTFNETKITLAHLGTEAELIGLATGEVKDIVLIVYVGNHHEHPKNIVGVRVSVADAKNSNGCVDKHHSYLSRLAPAGTFKLVSSERLVLIDPDHKIKDAIEATGKVPLCPDCKSDMHNLCHLKPTHWRCSNCSVHIEIKNSCSSRKCLNAAIVDDSLGLRYCPTHIHYKLNANNAKRSAGGSANNSSKKQKTVCKHCKGTDHCKISSNKCTKNPKHPNYVELRTTQLDSAYECENDCGFEGAQSVVVAHERSCNFSAHSDDAAHSVDLFNSDGEDVEDESNDEDETNED
jgi:hypothetical protein